MIELKIKNLDRLIDITEQFPAIAEKHVNQAIARSIVRILGQEKREAPFGVTGHLRDNWATNFGRFTGSLRSNSEYSAAVEYGTSPHYVSPQQLAPWAAKKGLNPYAVSKSILKKGTKANPFFKRSVSSQESDVQNEFDIAIKNILKEVSF